jgi:AmmeMemoRadiSam system protein A
MAHSPSTELSPAARLRLLRIARDSIAHGLVHQAPMTLTADDRPGVLGARLASFVTLRQEEMLRGCVGSMEPVRPLAESVAEAAFNAAFRDSRFPPLQEKELRVITIDISVLSALEPVTAPSEAALLSQLEPGVDGLLLEEGWRRATFLPKVWEQLSAPEDFLRALKQKAGLPPNYWSESMRFRRYRTTSFSDVPQLSSASA